MGLNWPRFGALVSFLIPLPGIWWSLSGILPSLVTRRHDWSLTFSHFHHYRRDSGAALSKVPRFELNIFTIINSSWKKRGCTEIGVNCPLSPNLKFQAPGKGSSMFPSPMICCFIENHIHKHGETGSSKLGKITRPYT